MNWKRRFLMPAAVLVLFSLLASPAALAWSYYQPVPRQTIGIARPSIGQQFILEAGEHVVRAEMWLNAQPVPVSVSDSGWVGYTPPAPLPPGQYQVRLIVTIDSGTYIMPQDRTFTFTVAEGALVAPPAPGPEELRALAYVNQLRTAVGLSLLQYDPALGVAALSHARYLVENSQFGHGEQEGHPFFTGDTPGARDAFFGGNGGVSEIVHFVGTAEKAVDGWMETLYHRLLLIDPACGTMGYGQYGTVSRANVIDARCGGSSAMAVAWPYPGQTGVPTQWSGGEVPDPMRLFPEATGPVGYTITLSLPGDDVTLESAALTLPDGSPVPFMAFSPRNDHYLTNTVGLIPFKPLLPGTTYRVRMEGQVDAGRGPEAYRREWTFTTALEQSLTLASASYRAGHVSLAGTGFQAGMQLFLNGLPVRNLRVESEGQLSFDTPLGYRGESGDLLAVTAGGQEVVWSRFAIPVATPGPETVFGHGAYTLAVAGKAETVEARIAPDGQVLISETALRRLGARSTAVTELHRTYWRFGSRTGDLSVGSVLATFQRTDTTDGTGLNLEKLQLPLPPQVIDGLLYLPAPFAERLLATRGLSDISGHWAREAIARLVEAGVISGYPDGTFRPADGLSRAAFVKMLVSARKLPLQPGETGGFPDAAGHWLAVQGYLGAAVEAGVLRPGEFTGSRLEPDRPITREEIAVMLVRAMGLEERAQSTQVTTVGGLAAVGDRLFTDAAAWNRPGYIAAAVEEGIITGYPVSKTTYAYRPGNPANRAEAAIMIARMLWPDSPL